MTVKTKIVIKLKKDGWHVDYEAKVGVHMMVNGYTRDGKYEVRQIIRRALRGGKPLPNRIKDIAVNVARQVLLWIDVYKVEGATAGMRIDVGEYSDISIYAAVRYYDGEWTAELIAILDGFDGFTNAWHRIVRKVKLGKRLDDAAGLLLQMNLLKAAKYAYNIYVDDDYSRSSYFDDDDSYDSYDDDDYSDDDDSTSLKTLTP